MPCRGAITQRGVVLKIGIHVDFGKSPSNKTCLVAINASIGICLNLKHPFWHNTSLTPIVQITPMCPFWCKVAISAFIAFFHSLAWGPFMASFTVEGSLGKNVVVVSALNDVVNWSYMTSLMWSWVVIVKAENSFFVSYFEVGFCASQR